MPTSPTLLQMQTDWQRTKDAHVAAMQMWDAQGKWRRDTALPWFDAFFELAAEFKAKHGVVFDPTKPVVAPYEYAEEARDFDVSVQARTSHMHEKA